MKLAPGPAAAAGEASNGSTTGSQHADGRGGSGELRSGEAAVAMGPRTDSQDIAAAADLIATLSRRKPTAQATGDQQLPPLSPRVTVDGSAHEAPSWLGMLPAPEARVVASNEAPASMAAGAAKPPAPARDRSPYARRGSHIPLGDRPPPKPASSVKFSRRNAPYVCQARSCPPLTILVVDEGRAGYCSFDAGCCVNFQ